MASNSSSIITGMNPMAYNSANPIPLFIIQLLIIIFLCRFLHIFLSRLLQPRVIAEIIAGIILGPTVLGRWKAFNDNVFPKSSLTVLNLVSNIGLILFLFMVGLELDPKMLKRNIHKSIMISVAGIVLPFALGIATSYGLFKLLHQSGSFVIFMLFCGVAMGITAFPVLARILTELNLLKTTVGSISISAAAVDDVVSWCLLALVVALTNNASGLSALWVFLVGLGWTLFILMVVRPVYIWYLHRKGCLEPNREPPQHVIFLTFAMIFISAWFTDVIGIHAIFGGFLIGIIVPHSGGFAIKIIEKIEDLVVIFFLPIYFALSGLKTNLSDLNDGVTWGLLILIIFVAFIGKIIGCTLAARLNKFNWRESLTIGFLMNCKGLVELIVLNIGLDAGVINNKIFTMMVVKALVTTFVTTPVVAWLYPPKHQRRIEDDDAFDETKSVFSRYHGFEAGLPMNVFVVVNKIRHVPALVTLVDYLHHRPGLDGAGWPDSGSRRVAELGSYMYRPLQVFVLRLMELTSRESSVMRHAESEFFIRTDPILSMFRAFARVAHLVLRSSLLVTEPEQFGANIVLSAEQAKAHIIILQAYGQGSATISPDSGRVSSSVHTPWYEAIIGRTGGGNGDDDYQQYYTTAQQTAMVMSVFDNAKAVVAVFVDRGLGEDDSHYHHHCSMQQQQQQQQSAWGARGSRSDSADNYEKQSTRMARPSSFDSRDFDLGKDSLAMVPTYQVNDFSLDPTDQPLPPSRAHTDTPLIVLPFFGGPDDRQALRLVCDLCTHAGVRVLIIHYVKTTQPTDRDVVLSASDFPERPVIPATPAVHRSALAREETNPWDAVQQPEVRQFKSDPEGYRTPIPEDLLEDSQENESREKDYSMITSILDPRPLGQGAQGSITNDKPAILPGSASPKQDATVPGGQSKPIANSHQSENAAHYDHPQQEDHSAHNLTDIGGGATTNTSSSQKSGDRGATGASLAAGLQSPHIDPLRNRSSNEGAAAAATTSKSPRTGVTKIINQIRHRAKRPLQRRDGSNHTLDETGEEVAYWSYPTDRDGTYETRYPNLSLETVVTSTPLQAFLSRARGLRQIDLIVCGRNRGTRMKYFDHTDEIAQNDAVCKTHVRAERRKALGEVGERVIGIGSNASLLVVQHYNNSEDDTTATSSSSSSSSNQVNAMANLESGVHQQPRSLHEKGA